MNATSFWRAAAVMAVAVSAACTVRTTETRTEPALSENVDTSEIWASMSAQSYGDGIRVYAAALKGSTFLTLSGNDAFVVDVGDDKGVVLTMQKDVDEGVVRYMATFPQNSAETPITLGLVRRAGRASAPSSTTFVPPAFAITSAPPAEMRRGAPIEVTIDPPPVLLRWTDARPIDQMVATIDGTCVDGPYRTSLTFDSRGRATIDTTRMRAKGTEPQCEVTVQVRHETAGRVDSAFHRNGTDRDLVEGLQARSFRTILKR